MWDTSLNLLRFLSMYSRTSSKLWFSRLSSVLEGLRSHDGWQTLLFGPLWEHGLLRAGSQQPAI